MVRSSSLSRAFNLFFFSNQLEERRLQSFRKVLSNNCNDGGNVQESNFLCIEWILLKLIWLENGWIWSWWWECLDLNLNLHSASWVYNWTLGVFFRIGFIDSMILLMIMVCCSLHRQLLVLYILSSKSSRRRMQTWRAWQNVVLKGTSFSLQENRSCIF